MATRTPVYPSRLPAEYELDQDTFVSDYLDVRPGHHISMIGPNGTGKTTLGFKLMNQLHLLHPQTSGLVLVMKRDKGPKGAPRGTTGDPTVSKLARRYGAPITRNWPLTVGQKALHPKEKTPFWVFWPKHSDDFRKDKVAHRIMFDDALSEGFKSGRRFVFADEVAGLAGRLRLGDALEHIWTQGRSSEYGIVGATQRPAGVPLYMYNSARHIFLWKDKDREARKRYAEISGMDPKRLLALADGLRSYRMPNGDMAGECLYVHPETETLAVLRPR